MYRGQKSRRKDSELFYSLNNNDFNLQTSTLSNTMVESPQISQPAHTISAPDTGASDHFFGMRSRFFLNDVAPALNPVRVRMPNGDVINSTHTASIPGLQSLPDDAKTVHLFPDSVLPHQSLLSVGKLCDAQCTAVFTAKDVTVKNQHGHPILTGSRNQTTRLWDMDWAPQQQLLSASLFEANLGLQLTTQTQRTAYYHATLCTPVLSTMILAANKGFLRTFPGLQDATILRKTPPHAFTTAEGHLDSLRKNVRSTKPRNQETEEEEFTFPPIVTSPSTDNSVFCRIMTSTGEFSVDTTGRIPEANCYIVIMYSYDCNYIHPEVSFARTKEQLTTAIEKGLAYFSNGGIDPQLLFLDNEINQLLKQKLKKREVKFQLVPPHKHRRLAAERAIRTFKNHFISCMASTDPAFPLEKCHLLLHHAELTLNLLRGSRLNPRISAWECVRGPYDFNAHPIAPPGTLVCVHEMPEARASWAPHCVKGFYIGPAFDHYRCYRVWVLETDKPRISDTLEWFPHQVTMPSPSAADTVIAAITDLVSALSHFQRTTPEVQHSAQPIAPTISRLSEDLTRLQSLFTPRAIAPTLSDPASISAVEQRVPQLDPAQMSASSPVQSVQRPTSTPASVSVSPAASASEQRVSTTPPSTVDHSTNHRMVLRSDTRQDDQNGTSPPRHLTNIYEHLNTDDNTEVNAPTPMSPNTPAPPSYTEYYRRKQRKRRSKKNTDSSARAYSAVGTPSSDSVSSAPTTIRKRLLLH